MVRRMVTAAALMLIGAPLAAQSSSDRALERIVPQSPAPAGFIADVPDVVPPAVEDAINGRIAAMQSAGRGDVGVAVLPSIGDFQPYEVGVAIYREWRIGSVAEIGSARRDLGALLLIVPKELAPDDRGHCWITTGRGAEGLLTDAAVGTICRDRVVPRLREQDYGGAIVAGVAAIDSILAGDASLIAAERGRGDGGSAGTVLAWVLGFIGSVIASTAAFFGIRRRRRNRPRTCPSCGREMHRVDEAGDDAFLEHGQQVEERVKSVDYDVWLCGACGTQRPERYARWITSYRECSECGAKTARTKRQVLDAATTTSTGLAEDTTTCEACSRRSVERVVLPKVTASSGGGSGRGGGGGGGSSFGGSGATSGGGAGSSY